MLAVGLMSGTSLDVVDAVLADMRPAGARIRARVAAHHHRPYEPPLARRLLAVQSDGSAPLAELASLAHELAEEYAAAVAGLLAGAAVPAAEVRFVAAHGQTLFHQPPRGARPGRTWQLGEPAVLAARTGLPVVSGFRAADMAAGGQGAPLVPLPDWHLFSDPAEGRAVQNIGGIANVTWLPAGAGPGDTAAFDTGPGNILIDAAVRRETGGAAAFDRDGERASRGRVEPGLLGVLLSHPFFRLAPPKSTGREEFGDAFLEGALAAAAWRGRGDDLVATVTACTAESIASAYRAHLPRVDRVLVGGGGAKNPVLLRMLRERVRPAPVDRTEAFDVPAEAREALAFAILGLLALRGEPGNLPAATGAARAVVSGSLTPAPGGRNA